MRCVLYRLLCRAERVCLTLVWLLFLLSFHTPPLAMLTLLCALLHELGHIGAAHLIGRHVRAPQRRLNGLLLPLSGPLSYRQEMLVAAAGPLANGLTALVCLALRPLGRAFFDAFATLSLMTGAANLLPVAGYDGERMLRCLLSLRRDAGVAHRVCSALSLGLSAVLTLLSLYVMLRVGGGFWVCGVFFVTLLVHMHKRLCEPSLT